MSFDYFESAIDARAMLAEFDAPLVALTWTPPPESDAPDAPTPDPVTVQSLGLMFDYNARQLGTQRDALIQVGDKRLFWAAVDEEGLAIAAPPAECRCIAPDGREYVVKNVGVLAPAGTVVLYELNLRRG